MFAQEWARCTVAPLHRKTRRLLFKSRSRQDASSFSKFLEKKKKTNNLVTTLTTTKHELQHIQKSLERTEGSEKKNRKTVRRLVRLRSVDAKCSTQSKGELFTARSLSVPAHAARYGEAAWLSLPSACGNFSASGTSEPVGGCHDKSRRKGDGTSTKIFRTAAPWVRLFNLASDSRKKQRQLTFCELWTLLTYYACFLAHATFLPF